MENQRGGNVRTAWFAIAGFKNKRRGQGQRTIKGLQKLQKARKWLLPKGARFQPSEKRCRLPAPRTVYNKYVPPKPLFVVIIIAATEN